MTFVFYDFETTGTSPAFDQPIQFAGIRTDQDLSPIDEINIRCRLSPHILPAPWALAVTGVGPETLNDETLPTWFEFVEILSGLIDRWGPATWTGYNSISFDEEMFRQSLYQNLHPNFYRTQFDGNDRLDLTKIVYSVWELAPETLEWPLDDRGRNTFKLDQLAPANGFTHHDAHDALGDVLATIHIAKLIRDRAPAVWDQALRNRSKHEVNEILESGQPLRLVERYGAAPPKSYIGALSGRNDDNPNSVGFLDLNLIDPQDLADADDDTLIQAVSATPKLVRTLAINKCPSLYEYPEVSAELADRAAKLSEMTDLHIRIGKALADRYPDKEESEHVEERIYSGGFYSSSDKDILRYFAASSWEQRVDIAPAFDDLRLRQLAQRTIFLNSPESLDVLTRRRLGQAIKDRWDSNEPNAPWTTFNDVEKQLEEIEQAGAMSENDLSELKRFYTEILRNT